jgi:hypothetical protein
MRIGIVKGSCQGWFAYLGAASPDENRPRAAPSLSLIWVIIRLASKF